MATRQWWERPRLWGAEATAEERRVSWLELFSDLIFVVVISQLAHYLAGHLSWSGLLGYGLFFVAAWWSWSGGTVYNERFETQDLSYRLLTFLQILSGPFHKYVWGWKRSLPSPSQGGGSPPQRRGGVNPCCNPTTDCEMDHLVSPGWRSSSTTVWARRQPASRWPTPPIAP